LGGVPASKCAHKRMLMEGFLLFVDKSRPGKEFMLNAVNFPLTSIRSGGNNMGEMAHNLELLTTNLPKRHIRVTNPRYTRLQRG
jgi:hypothetical protein